MANTDERTLMLDDESDYDIRCQQLRQDNAALLGRLWETQTIHATMAL
jgi:hypothetical protein